MRLRALGLLTFACGVLVSSTPAIAHHSFAAEFDSTKVVTKQGFVTKIDWTNPHVWFYINVKDEAGKISNWGFEMGPPHGLQTRGWSRTTMKLGDEISVNGTLARNGSNRGNARTVTMVSTGKRLGAASSETDSAQQ